MNISSSDSPCSDRGDFGSRRIFNSVERRHLSTEAMAVACCLLNSRTVSPDITEKAIQQAVVLGTMSGVSVDEQTFEALFEAVTLNPSFRIPFSVTTSLNPSNSWVC